MSTTMTQQDKRDLMALVVAVANARGFADLADIAGASGESGLSGHRVRSLIKQYGTKYGIEYHAAWYQRGQQSNSQYFGRCGSGFGGPVKATVSISKKLMAKVNRKRQAR